MNGRAAFDIAIRDLSDDRETAMTVIRRDAVTYRRLMAALMGLITASAWALDPARTLSQFHHTAWTLRDGAPTDVYALAQGADGWLWLGTSVGLFRFDGVRFERFEPANGERLPSGNISALLALTSGDLWIGLRFGGAVVLRDGALTTYAAAEGLPPGTVFGFAQGHDGTVWTATTNGLARLRDGTWERLGPAWQGPEKFLQSIFVDRSGTLWAVANSGVYALAKDDTAFRRQAMDVQHAALAQAPSGVLWVLDERHGLRPLASSATAATATWLRPEGSGALLFDRDGSLWAGNLEGLHRIVFANGGGMPAPPPAQPSIQQIGTPQGLSGDAVLSMLEDREGNLWVGTSGGLDRFRANHLTQVTLPPRSLALALAAGDDGSIWLGSLDRNLAQLDGRSGAVLREYPQVGAAVTCAWRDGDGALGFGGPAGLWRLDRERFARIVLPDGMPEAGIQAAIRDAGGSLWISMVREGLYQQRPDGSWARNGDQPGLPRATPTTMALDAAGGIWFGYTQNRLARLHRGTVRTFAAADGLNVGNVLAVHASRKGRLWIGGEFGLAVQDGERFRPLLDERGQIFRGISGIAESTAGELWINGAEGITRIADAAGAAADTTGRLHVERFDVLNGLTGTSVQIRPLPSAIEARDGRLWFATNSHLVWIDPAAIRRNPLPPPVTIRAVNAGDRRYSGERVLTLPQRTTSLSIEYTALSLTIPERMRFRYRLEGSDSDWQDVGTRREAFYTHLEPGEYRFRVAASNNDGVWNEEGAVLDFVIPPAFHQTLGFRLLCVLAGLGAAWMLYLFRVRRTAARVRALLEERHLERERIARELHDTLLQGIQGLILRFHAITKRLPASEPARPMLESALDRADEVLVQSRDRVRDLRAWPQQGEHLHQSIARVGTEFAQADAAMLYTTVTGRPRRLDPLLHDEIHQIAREALFNAIRHADADRIEVHVGYGVQALTLDIRDDGRGIDPQVLRSGGRPGHFGLHGMRERAARIGVPLEIAAGAHNGTVVRLCIPAALAYRGRRGRRARIEPPSAPGEPP